MNQYNLQQDIEIARRSVESLRQDKVKIKSDMLGLEQGLHRLKNIEKAQVMSQIKQKQQEFIQIKTETEKDVKDFEQKLEAINQSIKESEKKMNRLAQKVDENQIELENADKKLIDLQKKLDEERVKETRVI